MGRIGDGDGKIPRVYFIESGFLATGNLLRTEQWVKDQDRRHCNICMQQFHAFRRRHHCRTCGEVLCGSCSKHKRIRLIELNHDLTVRICTFCIMQATDATREVRGNSKSSIARVRENIHRPSTPRLIVGPGEGEDVQDIPDSVVGDDNYLAWRRTSQKSQYPQGPALDNTSGISKLDHARQADTFCPDDDNTLNVLVHLVSSSFYSHLACIGLSSRGGDIASTFQASIGLDTIAVTPVDVCKIPWTKGKTYISDDTHLDPTFPSNLTEQSIRYYAGAPIRVGDAIVGAVVVMDKVPHTETSLSQRNTLESVARIAAEVLEERGIFGTQKARKESHDTIEDVEQEDSTVDSEMEEIREATLPQSAQSNLMLLAVSRQSVTAYDRGIQSALMFYRALLRSAWELEREEDGTRLFSFDERYQRGYLKATKVLSVDGRVDWCKMLDLHQTKVYGDIVQSVSKRKIINLHTTLDLVRFHHGTQWRAAKESTNLLCHRRQYPGGAWTMIAMDASDMQFCFAWLISPHTVGTALVSIIVPYAAPHEELLFHLLSRVQKVVENIGDLRLSSCSGTADILESRVARSYSCSMLPTPSDNNAATSSNTSQFWDLLGKTVLTQQLLSQQQSSMLQTIEENDVKLKRLSTAVERVEALLDNHM